jgi:NAD(P)-dependent dehydrogenase (short-subunit alcohol dehydrogenase family)
MEQCVKQSELFNINGHVGFVTGAASGLGLACAEVMAENGATVVLADIDAIALDKATTRLSAMGCIIEPAVLDISDSAALQAAIDGAADRYGRLDAVFANAGVTSGPGFALSPAGEIDAMDLSLFRRALEVNLVATFMTMRFAATHMKRRKSGSIIATASIAGLRSEGLSGYGYTAAKAAVIGMVRQAAVELAPHNVRVNAIAPGPFLTNIGGGRLHREPEIARRFAASAPLSRMAQPDEIKGLALLLASPAGSFITGAIIPIDGGATAG